MVDRKYTEMLPGPFPNFLNGAWEQHYVDIWQYITRIFLDLKAKLD